MISCLISRCVLIIWVALCSACGSRRVQLEQQDSQVSLRSMHKELTLSDSVYRRYSGSRAGSTSGQELLLEIYPRGAVGFSPDSGFSGEASLLRMWTRSRQSALRQDSALVVQQRRRLSMAVEDSSRVQRSRFRQKEVNRSPAGWIGWLTGLAGGVLGWQLKKGLQRQGLRRNLSG